jgi:hypothetical protein
MDIQNFKRAEEIDRKIRHLNFRIKEVDTIINFFDWKLHENYFDEEPKYLIKIVQRDIETYEDEDIEEIPLSKGF